MKNSMRFIMNRARSLAILAAIACGSDSTSLAAVVTFNATQDTRIISAFPDLPFGALSPATLSLVTNATREDRVLLQFDLSSIPAGQTIVSATLQLNADPSIDPGGNPDGRPIDVYRLTSSWNQAEATWNDRAASTPWAAAGGVYVGSGGNPYASNSTVIPDNYASVVPLTWNVNSLVNEWYTGAQANNGMLLLTSATVGLHFPSSEVGGSLQPTLTVSYVPEPTSMGLLAVGLIGLAAARRKR